MFLLTFQEFGEWVFAIFIWLLEGMLGCVSAAAHVRSDVPPLQCIAGAAFFVTPVILIDIFVVEKIKQRRMRKKWEKGDY